MNHKIYLDNNASTPLDPRVIATITELLPRIQGNPSSLHSPGREARAIVSRAREGIAQFFGVKENELLFTSGGTDSAHKGVAAILAGQTGGHIISSETEHACIYDEILRLRKTGYEITLLKPTSAGCIDVEDVRKAVRPDTKMIALMSVNNETGVKNDVASIAQVALGAGVPFLVDAVAALGKEPIEIPEGVSAMTFSGHKIHVPAGIGLVFLASSKQTKAAREIMGHNGTENLIGIAALHRGIEIVQEQLIDDMEHMRKLRDRFEDQLKSLLKCVRINGTGSRAVNVSNICFHGVDGESLLIALDRHGIAASHGSACSSGAQEPSRVLRAMGIPLADVRSSVRFSFSRMNTSDEVDGACKVIVACVA